MNMEGTIGVESNSKLPAGETDDVNSEVVPSVDSDKNSPGWDLAAKITKLRDNVQKRKRPRRKSKKRKYPYSRASWQQKKELRNAPQQQFANGQPVAPYNTTQFLIEDHGDLENIDAQLRVVKEQNNPLFNSKPSRARDSSFSVDSDEDYFYSSPEDEEEFLTKEFSNAYEDLHVERLSSMSKSEIIHDYLQLEAKYEKAIIELKRLKKGFREDEEEPLDNSRKTAEGHDTDASSKSENELAEQLKISQLENKGLRIELEELQQEHKSLLKLIEKNQSSSVDSESDSSSTSALSGSSCDSDSDDEMNSTNNTLDRTQNNNTEQNSTETNYSKHNGENGNLSLSEDEGERQETDK